MNVFQLIGVALGGVIIALTVKQINSGFAVYVAVITSIILTFYAVGYFSPLLEYARELSEGFGMDPFVTVILRVTGIGAISKLACEICSDAGESAIGGRVELLCKGAIAVCILPVLKSLVTAAGNFLT